MAVVREASADAASLNSMDSSAGLLNTAKPEQQEAFQTPEILPVSSGKLIFAPEEFRLEAGVQSDIERDKPY